MLENEIYQGMLPLSESFGRFVQTFPAYFTCCLSIIVGYLFSSRDYIGFTTQL